MMRASRRRFLQFAAAGAVAAPRIAAAESYPARAVRVTYEPLPAITTIDDAIAQSRFHLPPARVARGDVDAALAAAPRTLDGEVDAGLHTGQSIEPAFDAGDLAFQFGGVNAVCFGRFALHSLCFCLLPFAPGLAWLGQSQQMPRHWKPCYH